MHVRRKDGEKATLRRQPPTCKQLRAAAPVRLKPSDGAVHATDEGQALSLSASFWP